MYFQQAVEKKAYETGGGKFVAPAQRMVDFVQNKISSTLPDCSYLPGFDPPILKTYYLLLYMLLFKKLLCIRQKNERLFYQ